MKPFKLFCSIMLGLTLVSPAIANDINSHNKKTVLEYSVQGSGKYTVLFESGFGTDKQVWEPVLEHLPNTIRVITYSRKGLGESPKPPMPQSIGQHLSDLGALLDATHIKSNLILVGHSYGGLLATEYANGQTGKVIGLVLIDPTTWNQRQVFKQANAARIEKDDKKLLGYMPWEMQADYRMLMSQLQYSASKFEPLASDLPTILFTSTARFDDPFVFEETKKGRAIWLKLHSELFSQVRNGSHIRTSNAGHNIHTEQPERIANAIAEIVELIENEN